MSDQKLGSLITPQCPIRTTLEMLGGKWRLLIIQAIHQIEKARFRDIKDQVPEISDKVLSDELKTLEQNRLLTRTESKSAVFYELTPIGQDALALIGPIAQFGKHYLERMS
ncbi:MAG: transcriptional regulator [Bacteroidetes bacterium]|jgi:DNA-binding HxlR family transcriptional regulator|nr:transcriptional regulator [Bacteroidota bacterium]